MSARSAGFKLLARALPPFRPPLRLGDGWRFASLTVILSFPNGNIKHLFGKLDGITRTFGHEPSMPQVSGYFETETLPIT
jgi:hypothetical protein